MAASILSLTLSFATLLLRHTSPFPTCTARCFAMVVSSLRSPPRKRSQGGGALSSTCNATEEIFKIAAIMNGLVLVGVAVGFVLLRVEASLEEAE
ncbi:unnamed protein product [Musa acuminata subsp. malaccensis]|uniref:(wild Malaysian banana) hypothetical protein n=1 Tax=Musa acuminata subsp. malaccensis TaxID=214687 RepID=A0A804KP76_MUSAM|nr:unnamed protein product [Musa acuminata subsp. malaccensis]